MNKKVKYLALAFSVSGGLLINGTTASASSIYDPWNPFWHNDHWVTLTKNVRIEKVKNVYPKVDSYSVGHFVAKKGYHYKLHHSGINIEWSLRSGRFHSNRHYTYAVAATGHKWFKYGIH